MKLEIVGGTREVIVPLAGKGKLYGTILDGENETPFGSSGVEGRLVMPASLGVGSVVVLERGDTRIEGKVKTLTNDLLELAGTAKEAAKPEGKSAPKGS